MLIGLADSRRTWRRLTPNSLNWDRRESDRTILLVGLDVFGADSHAYEAGEQAAEECVGREEAEDTGWFDGAGVAENL